MRDGRGPDLAIDVPTKQKWDEVSRPIRDRALMPETLRVATATLRVLRRHRATGDPIRRRNSATFRRITSRESDPMSDNDAIRRRRWRDNTVINAVPR
ncbi:hypothetical protein QU42_07970 [Bradyrhizobium sp. UASWS1016]|jgi:hypothetical protein|nr:hypothetical protein QU41_18845 [Bradyrhizobium elkanii]OCX31733.1 hypothetical protein QU42_07970 [Bradyrhizobium sp. UASWS1016]